MTEKPDNVIRPSAFRGREGAAAASEQPLTLEQIRAAGATPLNDVRMDKAMGGVVRDAVRGAETYVVVVRTSNELHHITLNAADLKTPLKEIPAVAKLVGETGAERIEVVSLKQNGAVLSQKSRVFTKDMMGESIAESFAKEKVFPELAEKTLGQRVGAMSGREKAWTAANAAMVGLFLYSAIDNFRHSVEKNPLDPQAPREIHWSQLTWGTVNTMLAGLSAMQVASAVRGHPMR